MKRSGAIALLTLTPMAMLAPAVAGQKTYDPGASDTEIKIGNIAAYTGIAQAFGAVAHAEAAYFTMINDRGGINGRTITFISRDSGSGARDALDLARDLVERDGVLLIFSPLGTQTNLAIRSYMNANQIPQLFIESSSAAFNDPVAFPWTMGFFATYHAEGSAYAKYVRQTRRGAKIAILSAAQTGGNEYLAGVHDGLGDMAATAIVKEVTYEGSDASFEPQIAALKDSGADVFFNFSVGVYATRAIRAAYDAGWHPLQFIPNASLSVTSFLEPAGLDAATGIIANARSKGWLHPKSGDDPAVRDFLAWMSTYNPQASLRDQNTVAGYERAQTLVEVLKRCGDELTRVNIMKQAASLDIELGMLLPGIKITTSPTDYQPIKQLYLIRFDGRDWVPLGPVI